MDDIILRDLKRVVEQAVRPVRAAMTRKRRMREELLAHLAATFEKEVELLGNERAALDRAAQRFGNPQELTAQLQDTVPCWDICVRLGEAGSLQEPYESLLHFSARIAILALMMFAAAMLVLMPVACILGRPNEFTMRAHFLFCIATLNIPLTLGVILLANGMYRALYRVEGVRSWRLAAVYALFSLIFFPVLAFAWYLSLTGDFAMSFAHLRFACCLAPAAPLLFALMASQTAEQMRDDEEWASLEIDG